MVLLKCLMGTSYPELSTVITRKSDQVINDYLAITLYWFPKKEGHLSNVYLLKYGKPDFWLHFWSVQCVCKRLPLDFCQGMHWTEQAMSPTKSVCCQAEERLVSVRHGDSERAEELENQVHCFLILQMAVSSVFSAVQGCSGTESLYLLLKETWFCRCSVHEGFNMQ